MSKQIQLLVKRSSNAFKYDKKIEKKLKKHEASDEEECQNSDDESDELVQNGYLSTESDL